MIGSTSREREQPASARLAEGGEAEEDGADDIGPYGVKKGRSVTARTDRLEPEAVAEAREGVATVRAWLRGLEAADRLIFELRRSAEPQSSWPEIAAAVEVTLSITMSPANARQIYQRLQNKADADESTAWSSSCSAGGVAPTGAWRAGLPDRRSPRTGRPRHACA